MKRLKVVIISFEDTRGAGLCAYRIHKSLQRNGIESTMLVANKTQRDDTVICVGKYKRLMMRIVDKAIRVCGLTITERNKLMALSLKYSAAFSSPHSAFDLSEHPAVKNADVIHLHWVGNFLDYQSFFDKVKKPIVWTLHDENLFFGIAHYSKQVIADNELERKYYALKRALLSDRKNLGIVFLSKMMYEQYLDNAMIKSAKKTIINNSVDTSRFSMKDKELARSKYGLEKEAIVLVFVAAWLNDPRKGLEKLLAAVERMPENIMVLGVGGNPENFTHPNLISTGLMHDTEELSQAYSAADYFVMPSSQEAFAQTPIEAMACGKPAVVFPVSGTEELINDANGVRCVDFTVDALIEGLRTAFSRHYDAATIREDVRQRFSPDAIAQKYIDFYKEMKK